MATSVSSLDAPDETGPPQETCGECGFQAARWSRQDAIRSLELAGRLVGLTIEGLSATDWLALPTPGVPSIADRFHRLTEVLALDRSRAEAIVASLGSEHRAPPGRSIGEASELDRLDILGALDRTATGYGAYLRSVDDRWWGNTLPNLGEVRSLDALVRHSCHEMMHCSAEIARTRHAVGDAVGPLTGTVASLHAGDGGVPKPEVPSARVEADGLVGDAQAARQYHGRPWQALCLWSTEVVEMWAAEGHPIFPGAAGENLSLSGLDWSQLRAGLIVEIGALTARLSAPAVPCTKNRRWFSDRDHRRLGHDVSPGRARWYAGVLTPGRVETGDPVTLGSDG